MLKSIGNYAIDSVKLVGIESENENIHNSNIPYWSIP